MLHVRTAMINGELARYTGGREGALQARARPPGFTALAKIVDNPFRTMV